MLLLLKLRSFAPSLLIGLPVRPSPWPPQAALIVADRNTSLQITGNGDVLEPHDGIISIGSGSPYALAAARALIDQPHMDALSIGGWVGE